MQNRLRYLTGGLFLLILLALSLGPVLAQETTPPSDNYPVNTITVAGTGTASGSPDIAHVQIGVEKVNTDIGTAFTQANETIDAVTSAVQDVGVAQEDIRTIDLNIFTQEPPPAPGTQAEETQREYRVSNRVNVTVRDVALIEDVINAAVDAGANNIFGLNFDIADRTELEREARSSAVEDARERAMELAELLDVELGDAIIISESPGGGAAPLSFAAAGRGGGGDAVVEPGQLTVSVQVQVTFRIRR